MECNGFGRMQHQGFRPRPGNIGDYVAIVRLEVACQLGLQWVKPSKMLRFNGSQIATHPYPSQLLPLMFVEALDQIS